MHNYYFWPSRKGVAPIEFLMFLPVLIAFAAVTMYIIKIHEAKQRSTLDAEILSIENAVVATQQKRLASLPRFHGTDSADLAQLVGAFQPTQLDIKAGIASGLSQTDTGGGVYGDIEAAGPANAEIGFLSQSWESAVLPFPITRSDQPPLTLPRCVRGIATGLSNLHQFTGLASLSGAVSSGSYGSPEGLAAAQEAAIRVGKHALESLNASIAKMEAELAKLERFPVANEGTIEHLEASIARARAQRDQLLGCCG